MPLVPVVEALNDVARRGLGEVSSHGQRACGLQGVQVWCVYVVLCFRVEWAVVVMQFAHQVSREDVPGRGRLRTPHVVRPGAAQDGLWAPDVGMVFHLYCAMLHSESGGWNQVYAV